jgi:hypothetical protein
MDPAASPDAPDWDAVLRRVIRWQLVMAAAGLAAWLLLAGGREAVSFALGAGLALFSFFLLHRAVVRAEQSKTTLIAMLLAATRYLLYAVIIFAIVKNYEVRLTPAITGISITVAAITLEAIYELIHART